MSIKEGVFKWMTLMKLIKTKKLLKCFALETIL